MMFTGYIDIDGKHVKDGMKNDLRTTRICRDGEWLNGCTGGYYAIKGKVKEFTVLKLGETKDAPVSRWCIYQSWWSEVPYKPYWRKWLLARWLRLKNLIRGGSDGVL